jgi:predicted amidohydrolase
MDVRVAGAQLPVTGDITSNVAAIIRAIDWAKGQRADILLTPEGSLSGYTHVFDAQAVAESLQCVTVRAREAGLGLALGTCYVEPDDDQCYNQIRFYARDGAYLGFHNKTLTCGSLTDPPEGEIEHYAVRPLRTFRFKEIDVGGLICNDLWANPGCTPVPDPHLSQQLASMGAQIIFHAVNGGRDGGEWSDVAWRYHEANLRMRARAGRVWVVTVDSCYPTDLRCSAPSGVIDPHGNWTCQARPRGEQFFAYTISTMYGLSARRAGR